MAYVLQSVGNYYTTRANGPVLIGVMHITAGATDYVAPDTSAEGTLNWFKNPASKVSIHGIVDSDTVQDCLPIGYTAWHAKGYNSRSIGLEIGTGQVDWRKAPNAWVDATIRNAAKWWAPVIVATGLPLVKVTKAQVDAVYRNEKWTKPLGFIGHGDLDPGNRTDPGIYQGRDTFPWSTLFAYIREEVARIQGVGGKLNDKTTAVTIDSFTGEIGPNTIRAWQTYYARAGRLPASAVDGVISEPSMLIREVQKDLRGIEVYTGSIDGYAGPLTWAALGKRFGVTGQKRTIQALQFDLWKRGLIR